jgi:hypothetical protein
MLAPRPLIAVSALFLVCEVDDPDDRNGPNGDEKNPGHGTPDCQPASP